MCHFNDSLLTESSLNLKTTFNAGQSSQQGQFGSDLPDPRASHKKCPFNFIGYTGYPFELNPVIGRFSWVV